MLYKGDTLYLNWLEDGIAELVFDAPGSVNKLDPATAGTLIVIVSAIAFFLSAFLSQRISFQSFRDGFRRITLYPSRISSASFSQASFPAWSLSRHRKTEVI